MSVNPSDRRRFLKASTLFGSAAILSGVQTRAKGFQSSNDRPKVAAIGTGSRWDQKATGIDGPHGSAKDFPKYGDYVAVCDADASRRERAQELVKGWGGHPPTVYADYREIIDRDDIDIVHISTPDHWHAKIAMEAMKSGKDVYCEKPMTLTIEEGQWMCQACRDSGSIVQIGTQQRSEIQFIKAIAMIRDGRIGKIKKVECSIGGAPASPQIQIASPPKELDWNLWSGPAPLKKFRYKAGPNGETKSWSRCHYEFRWWYEYSGGKLTDWGAHHVDIATWGMNKMDTGPISIDPLFVKHPVPFENGIPMWEDRYNTATQFKIVAKFKDGVELIIRHDQGNGILFEGEQGRIFVNRGRLTGQPVEDLALHPLPDGALEKAYKDRSLTNHFQNFFEAVAARKEPISDVFSHHRALSTCHLAGIAARLGRKINWDPRAEEIVGDERAQAMVGRTPRKGFEIEV